MNRREAIKLSFSSAVFGLIGSSMIMGTGGCNERNQNQNTYQILDDRHATVLNFLVDQIIPKTDVPGALEVGVVKNIDHYLAQFLNKQNSATVLEGLLKMEMLSNQLHGVPIERLNDQQKTEIMKFLTQDASRSEAPDTHLFFMIRKMVVKFYFQAPEIATQVLKYDPVPGRYVGCISYEDKDRVWAY